MSKRLEKLPRFTGMNLQKPRSGQPGGVVPTCDVFGKYLLNVKLLAMTTITFDTPKFVRKLQEAGFDEKQAEGLTQALRAAIDDSELVTRRDLREFELRLDPRFESIKGDMSLVKWMMGALIAIAAANFSKQFF